MNRFIKAVVSLSVLLAAVLSLSSVRASASEDVISVIQPDAERVELDVSCDSMNAQRQAMITDANYYTYYHAGNDTHIKFTAHSPVKNLYFMFEKPCSWKLNLPDGSVRQGGEEGFIHEFFSLDREVTEFEIDIPAGSSLTDVYAFTDGKVPDWVQIWQPPCQKADLMLMPTHADDEHLWFGGAMPYYAGELGYKVQVVYLTHHYRDAPRPHELLNGLWTVGVKNYPVITERFQDHRVTKTSIFSAEEFYGHDRVLEFQVEMLRRFSPRVIIAHDIKGEYGHGAHILNAKTLLEALEIYEDPSVYPDSAQKYGIHKVQKCYLHLWSENQIVVQWSDKVLEHFGGRTAYDMAVEGYGCHKSQHKFDLHVDESGRFDCRKFGLAYTTVGYDTPGLNDMFEHVDMTDSTADGDEEPENSSESELSETAVSASDDVAEQKISEKKTGINLFGKELLINDVLFASVAAALSLTAIIIVICLKKRE